MLRIIASVIIFHAFLGVFAQEYEGISNNNFVHITDSIHNDSNKYVGYSKSYFVHIKSTPDTGKNIFAFSPNKFVKINKKRESDHSTITENIELQSNKAQKIILNPIITDTTLKTNVKNTSDFIFKPPYLEIDKSSVQYSDNDNNQVINSNEKALIIFEVYNEGLGPAIDLFINTNEKNNVIGLKYEKSISLKTIYPNESTLTSIPIFGTENLTNDTALFEIYIKEKNGFNSDTIKIEIETKKFLEPNVKIIDYLVMSQTENRIKKGKPFDLQVLVQNVGKGKANRIEIELIKPSNVFLLLGDEKIAKDQLLPGEEWLIEYSLVTNKLFVDTLISLQFNLFEEYSQYYENRQVNIAINQYQSNKNLRFYSMEDHIEEIEIGSLISDIDRDFYLNDIKNPNRLVLVIGNEIYNLNSNNISNVTYAMNDAYIFKKLVINTLGVEERNVKYLTNATTSQMRKNINLISEMAKRIGSDAEIIFYYSGHGFPNLTTGSPYLIPVDVDISDLNSAIEIEEIYKKFGESGAQRVTIFLDACFSGGGRDGDLMAGRSIRIKPKFENNFAPIIAFTATSEIQSALPYHKQKHGMFI